MGKYAEMYKHEGWIVQFSGRLHNDGTWDDSSDLRFDDGPTIYGVPLIGNNRFAGKDDAIRAAMNFARRWIETESSKFLNQRRQR